jgi:hypothetical protein
LCTGQEAAANLVFAGIMQPHFLHCWVKDTKNSQLLQMLILNCCSSSGDLALFLLRISHGLAGFSLVISIPLFSYKHYTAMALCFSNYQRLAVGAVHQELLLVANLLGVWDK